MNDHALLEQASKAIGCKLFAHHSRQTGTTQYFLRVGGIQSPWNPLEHDGDALRLAIELGIVVDTSDRVCVQYVVEDAYYRIKEYEYNDKFEATRRAIVRAAAEIGRNMKCNTP